MGIQNTVLNQFLSNSESQFLTDLLSKITGTKAELNKALQWQKRFKLYSTGQSRPYFLSKLSAVNFRILSFLNINKMKLEEVENTSY